MARKDSQHHSQAGPDGLPSVVGFAVEQLIGEGGFSHVYRGTQETPARPAAIKVFRTSGKVGARVRERFKRESDVIGALSSEDGLVTVFTGGFTGSGAPYLAMELCDGGSIADRIRTHGPLPVHEVVAVAERIGSALAVVHVQNVIHRDVKPSNILLKSDGRAMLTDFGLSVVGEMTEAFGEESRLAMTEVYAPPERLNPSEEDGAGVDAAGDQYSFALTLYAMLLGGSPFTGETTTKRALKALQGHIEPLGRTDVPPQLIEVLRRAMAAQPDQRWPSMGEFVAALRPFEATAPGVQESKQRPLERPVLPPSQSGSDPLPQESQRRATGGVAPPSPGPLPSSLHPSSVPGLPDEFADAPTSMPGAAPQPPEPMRPPQNSPAPGGNWMEAVGGYQPPGPAPATSGPQPGARPVGVQPAGPTVTPEFASEATRMPQRDAGIPVIEAPRAPEPTKNPKRTFYVGGAIAVSVLLVVVIGALVLRPDPGPGPDPDPGPDSTGVTPDPVALEPPTVDSVKRTDDGLAFTWTGDPADISYPVYKVQVDGDESGSSEPISDAGSGGYVREQFVASVSLGDGTVHEVDARQHEYCVLVRLIPLESDGVEEVQSEPKCLSK